MRKKDEHSWKIFVSLTCNRHQVARNMIAVCENLSTQDKCVKLYKEVLAVKLLLSSFEC